MNMSRCSRHRCLYPAGGRCPECRKAFDKIKRSKPNSKFYNSRVWKQKRAEIIRYYCGLDIFILGRDGKIVPCIRLTVHHIKELSKRPDLALNNDNLVTLSQASHEIVHQLYDSGRREEAVAILQAGIKKWKTMRGGIEDGEA